MTANPFLVWLAPEPDRWHGHELKIHVTRWEPFRSPAGVSE